MNPDRWQQIDSLLDEALDRKPEERPAFLDEACAGDPDLRREVEALLEAHAKAGSFVRKPVLGTPAAPPRGHPAASLPGKRLGPYEVLAMIGRGGMGEVYRARDTRLGRSVALKVLPPEFLTDEERMRRFRREAKAASALNHANVATIYDVGESEGTHYIAMEYVEGKTLSELIGRKGLKLGEALNYGMQIADALAAAHEAGIVHRDLKPGNVMVTPKGQVKVLDFGLAKWGEKVSFGGEDSQATGQPTTEEGRIVGTVAYMSPEQAEGKPVDARSDIFSFGSVLYEMVTGRRAFEAESTISTLTAILHGEPKPVSGIKPAIPADLEKLIGRCLRKDPGRRLQHIDDVKVALLELKEDLDSGRITAAAPARKKSRAIVWTSIIIGAGAVLAVAAWLWLSRPQPAAEESPLTPIPLTAYPGTETYPSFSADGTQVAFQWCPEGWVPGKNCDIYVKQIGVDPPSRLTDTPEQEYSPAWSPDGGYIAFLREVTSRRIALVRVPQRGGREKVVTEWDLSPAVFLPWPGPYLAWTPDSKWVAAPVPDAGARRWSLELFSVETGEKRTLTSPGVGTGEGGDAAPMFSPDGRILAFSRVLWPVANLCLVRLGESYLPQGDPEKIRSGNPYNIGLAWTPGGSEMVFSSGEAFSNIIFTGNGLWRVVPSASAVPVRLPFVSDTATAPTLSRQGNRLAYAVERADTNIWRVDLRGPDRTPTLPVRLISSTRSEFQPAISPDGKRIAFTSDRSGAKEIWLCDGDGSNPVPVTSFGKPGTAAVGSLRWSPDGRVIVFALGGDVCVVDTNGGAVRHLTREKSNLCPWPYLSHDGQSIYFRSLRSGGSQIWKMPAAGGDAVQITHVPHGADLPHESPDGKSIFYSTGWPNPQSVWMIPIEGGDTTKILDGVHPHALWTVAEDGIYFFGAPDAKGRSDLSVHEFATAKTRKILTVDHPVTYFINVSSDGRTILYPQVDEVSSDLMLVENFR